MGTNHSSISFIKKALSPSHMYTPFLYLLDNVKLLEHFITLNLNT